MLHMDPALSELYREGPEDDEVAVILRLRDDTATPARVRIVARFGNIATGRLRRGDIPAVRASRDVLSMKAPRSVVPDVAVPLEMFSEEVRRTDARRPAALRETGSGVVVGVVDWGLDFVNRTFRNADDSTRLIALWDQRGAGTNRYGYGTIHDRDTINAALRRPDPYATLRYDPADADTTGSGAHGTHVCDIAAGNGRGGGPSGMAPGADLIFVHLSSSGTLGDSVRLLEALDFIATTAGQRPWVVNLSMGSMAGPHDGTTLVESAIDKLVMAAPGRAIVNSGGNYFQKDAHVSAEVRPGRTHRLRWHVDTGDPTDNQLEVWYSARDRFSVRVHAPDGTSSDVVRLGGRSMFRVRGRDAASIYNRPVDPNNFDNHIEIFLLNDAPDGDWQVELIGNDIVDGRFHAWVERDDQGQSRLMNPDRTSTTGSICNGFRNIAVGAYDAHRTAGAPALQIWSGSSAGPTRDGRQKPDLCAPGAEVIAARSRPAGAAPTALPQLTRKSGTSMAAPHVAGTVALMFEAASPHRLSIEQTRRLLLVTTTPPPADLVRRGGSGVLDVTAAVGAADRYVPGRESEMAADDLIRALLLGDTELHDRFEIIGMPGHPLAAAIEPGDVLLRYAAGEGGMAHASVISGDSLAGAFESAMRGTFANVAEGTGIVARRVTNAFGNVPPSQFVLRPRSVALEEPELREDLPSSQLVWPAATAEQRAFMRDVYDAHVAWASSGGRPFIADIPASELETVEGDVTMRTAAARACREMLGAARAELQRNTRVSRVGITSGYRSASRQFRVWQDAFPRYYDETASSRAAASGGEHGPAAVALTVRHVRARVGAPGYSLHNNGVAADLLTIEGGRRLVAGTSPANIAAWRRTWFFSWLTENAATHRFHQNTRIDEPWHWEYRET